jgi:UDP-2,3-diacylglucosamine hydrolase
MEISAPAHWQTVDFLSDLHLDRADSPTLAGVAHYLGHSPAQALMVLGDLFEAWVGDDALGLSDGVEQQVAALLHQASQRMNVFIMCGNRDFLMGANLMHACGARALADPSVLQFAGQRYLLSHGDALCLSDTDYLAFRKLSRSPAWQQDFLSKPLQERQALGRQMRAQSKAHQAATRQSGGAWHDLDTPACLEILQSMQADTMIHGHTHHPDQHVLSPGKTRWVLSDWDFEAQPPRADLLRLSRPAGAPGLSGEEPRLQRISALSLSV